MIVLREPHSAAGIARLGAAWSEPETFILLPAKTAEDAWIDEALATLPDDLQRDHFIMLTSGTTGRPKLVIGNRARAEQLARVLHARQSSQPVRETIAMLPLSYTFAFVNQWLWARVFDRGFVPTGGLSDPRGLETHLHECRDAMVCLVGAQVPLLLEAFPARAFPGVIRLHFAGGRFPQERLGDLARLFPRAEVFNNYGCAEAMPRLTIRRASDAPSADHIGWSIDGVELRAAEDGALMFRSAYGAVAVVEDHALTRLTPDGWMPTGDLARPLDDGGWRLAGRASEVFKRHGEKVSVASLADTVATVWTGAAAFYRDTDSLGEDACVLTLAPTPDAAVVRALLAAFRERHGRAQWPLRIEAVDALPLLANGKPDLQGLGGLPSRRVLWKQYL